MKIEAARALLYDALPEVKARLEWPTLNPVEWSHRITDEVMEAAKTKAGRAFLEREIPHGIIFSERLNLIEERLKLDHSDESKPIIKALNETRSRDHLALISLAATNMGEARVLIVDDAKNRLEMPAWKLVDLLDHAGSSRKLYSFPGDHYREKSPTVVFNQDQTGQPVHPSPPD